MSAENPVINETLPGNYKEAMVDGKKYTRCHEIRIYNPDDNTPHLTMSEQDVFMVNGEKIYRPASSLYTVLNMEDPLHLELYSKIYELYVKLREARDNG